MIDLSTGPLATELEARASTAPQRVGARRERGRGRGSLRPPLRQSGVEVRPRGTGAGSGIIWSADGLIVTNAHVARTDHATVVLWDGHELDGVVTAHDPRRDRATSSSDPGSVARAAGTIGHPTDLRTGDVVVALGHPWGITGS